MATLTSNPIRLSMDPLQARLHAWVLQAEGAASCLLQLYSKLGERFTKPVERTFLFEA